MSENSDCSSTVICRICPSLAIADRRLLPVMHCAPCTASRQCTMLLLLPLALGSITTATVGSDRTPTPEQLLYQQREVSGAGLAM